VIMASQVKPNCRVCGKSFKTWCNKTQGQCNTEVLKYMNDLAAVYVDFEHPGDSFDV